MDWLMNSRTARIGPMLRLDSFLRFQLARPGLVALWGLLLAVAARAAEASSDGLPVLTNVVQVREMQPKQAKQGFPVKLRGVVTYANPGWFLWFMQDETAGIYIYRQDDAGPLRAGQEIEVSGKTIQGLSGSTVATEQIRILGPRAMPVPRVLTAQQLQDGNYDGQWVEVEDLVRSVSSAGDHLQIRMGRRNRFCR